MKRKLISLLTVAALMIAMLTGCSPKNEVGAEQLADKKVGICIYQFNDNFMTLFRNELQSYLVSKGFSEENITIVDGANSQDTQTAQIQEFIDNKVDVLIVNIVNSSSVGTITDLVAGAGIPLVYINREPGPAEEQRWADKNMNVCYVGCDARQSGTYQGEIISDIGKSKVDLNKDGKVQYIMIEGDPENIDAQYRTKYSIKALQDAGIDVQCLDDQIGNWDMDAAKQLVAESLAAHPQTEVVFCNNDAMALGALESIKAAGRTVGTDIYLVGVDALAEAVDGVIEGTITGTVFNDHITQSHSAGDAAINYVVGNGNEHYIGCNYIKVTKDNAKKILDSVK
jgi:methyl-galactoside transport system substrate-binding protein